MSNDFKTKILIEKSKQEKKANLFIKYFISLGLVLLLGIFFFSFKDHLLNYFSKSFNEKNYFKEEERIATEPNPIKNNKNTAKNIISLVEIDISEECKKYSLKEELCASKNLYQMVLKQLNDKSKDVLSIESINEIYSEQVKSLLEMKEKSLINFSNNLFDKAYTEIIEANKIFNLINHSREAEFKKNMLSANKAYIKRDENSAKKFIYTAEKYVPDDKNMQKLKQRIINISNIIKLENDIKAANISNNTELEIDLIKKIKQFDYLITKHDDRLNTLTLLIKKQKFNNLMSEIEILLEDNEISSAKKKLSLAKKIFPNNYNINILKKSINEKDKINKINALIKEVQNLIRDDKWLVVKNKYEEILILDNTNIYAINGLNHAQEIIQLLKNIGILNNTPLLLTKSENLNKGNLLLKTASEYKNKSKTLFKIANLLENNIKLASEPAIVNIRSDNKTDIKLKKVGIIGKVKNKTLSLKAGKYIFEGKRIGYKTILIKKEIALDEKNIFLEIICDEPI